MDNSGTPEESASFQDYHSFANATRLSLKALRLYDRLDRKSSDVFKLGEKKAMKENRSHPGILVNEPLTLLRSDRGNYHSPHAHEIRVWHARTGRLLRSLTYHQAPVIALTSGQDGQWILSCDRD
ncbi:MAG: hypothetical protein F6K32_05595 [Desertifilum sp. SIO1I2]|nr:hypothetical protein [Desertifilum sp. SIO1I2]